MSKIDLNTITNANNLSNINSNFQKIEDALNDGALWRDNPVGEPNQMSGNLDMNGFDVLNVGTVDVEALKLNGIDVEPSELVLASSLKIVNNLADVQSASAARANLGLGNVNNTADSVKPISAPQQAGLDLKLDLTGGTLSGPLVLPTVTGVTAFSVRPTFQSNTPWDSGNLNFASPPVIGASTPNNAFFNNLTINGSFTPVGGFGGTNTNNNAAAGIIGEYIETNLAPSAIGTTTFNNAASFILSPGDWDVSGNLFFNASAGSTNTIVSISTVASTNGPVGNYTQIAAATPASLNLATPLVRISIASNTTVYLIAYATFASGTCFISGRIRARRVR